MTRVGLTPCMEEYALGKPFIVLGSFVGFLGSHDAHSAVMNL